MLYRAAFELEGTSMRVLVTVAHPDDETFGCGSLLAHATLAGASTVVACATRGELGGDGAVRETELRDATALLGVDRVELLGWRDSGLDGPPAPGSLVAAPFDDVVAAVAALLEAVRPDVVVTLDASDGHRDHAVIRDATLAAVRTAAWRPARTYVWCLPRSLMTRFTGDATLGTPDDEVTTVVDVAEHLDLRWRAMRAHASQVPPYDAMAPDLQRAFLAVDRLRRVDPPWCGGPIETDWLP